MRTVPTRERGGLRRSREHRIIAGVAGGMAAYVGSSTLLVRALWVIMGIAAPMIAIPLYIALAFLLPSE